MQIEKKQNHSTPSSFAAKSSGTKVAQEYAAIFPTLLALARWTRGGDIPHVHCFEHQLPMRSAWYEQAQRHFQTWLESGGFYQAEPGCIDSVIADASPQADERTLLSTKVVVHGGPRSASMRSAGHGAPDANEPGRGGAMHDRQDASGMIPPHSNLQSIPHTPEGGLQK